MTALLLAALLAAPAAAQERPVSGSVSGTLAGHWDLQDYQGRVWLSVSSFGGSLGFSGRPLSGSLFSDGAGRWTVSAAGVSGSISRFGNAVDVSASVTGPQGSRWVSFTMYVNGTGDAASPPSLSVFSGDASLDFGPTYRGYSMSGTVDDKRFGDEGVALAMLAAATVLKDLPAAKAAPLPKAGWLEKSAAVAPFLKAGFGR